MWPFRKKEKKKRRVVERVVVGLIIGGAIGSIIGFLVKVNDATDGWAGYILAAAAAWKYLNLSFLATPIGMILSLAAAIALLVDDFLTWKEGGDSLINWSAWESEIQMVTDILSGLRMSVENIFMAIYAAIDSVVSLLTGDFAGAWSAAKNLAGSMADILGFGSNSPAAALSPSPQAAAAMTSGAQTVSQQTQIVVQGSADPQATARAVSGQQSRVNADMTRNMKGAAR